MFEWFRRRGQQPKPLAEMTPEELDAALAAHPELAALLRSTLGIMPFAPGRTADAVLARVGAIVDEALRRQLPPDAEREYVLRELERVRREMLES
ncbi:MAG TPA: hypothetical protein VFW96_13315 [Thermomicrobiales bacterium]|nr:hypothetical protein [Thermomicrobiales bacterium]